MNIEIITGHSGKSYRALNNGRSDQQIDLGRSSSLDVHKWGYKKQTYDWKWKESFYQE